MRRLTIPPLPVAAALQLADGAQEYLMGTSTGRPAALGCSPYKSWSVADLLQTDSCGTPVSTSAYAPWPRCRAEGLWFIAVEFGLQ
mmetsp:Transcript_58397/g.96857  ORF Transcript_58397/g.96857 Transcript_58397/m.96857 type:complete len:86 (-) Transcript_58397:95-352(-)